MNKYKILKMKKVLTLIFTVISLSTCNAQFGVSLSYSTKNTLSFDGFYEKAKNRFHFGYGHQFNGQKNSVVSTRKANYGLTRIEDGDFFWHIDLGYSRIFFEKLTINPMLSFGAKNYFTGTFVKLVGAIFLINVSSELTYPIFKF